SESRDRSDSPEHKRRSARLSKRRDCSYPSLRPISFALRRSAHQKYPGRDSDSYAVYRRRTLSPLRLPIPPPGRRVNLHQVTPALPEQKYQNTESEGDEETEARTGDVRLPQRKIAPEIVPKPSKHNRPDHAAERDVGHELP